MVFTKQGHDEVTYDLEMCLPRITSSLEHNFFLKESSLFTIILHLYAISLINIIITVTLIYN